MSGTALLDTSALINTVDSRTISQLPYELLTLSSLTYAELRLGLVTAASVGVLRQRSRRIEEITRWFGPGLPFDDDCAIHYERIVQASVDNGQRPRTNTVDRMIAAVAVAHDLPLITSNPTDFRGLTNLLEVVAL